MKKSSLMGASVVAAALLAAAPVVAPVASLATPATQVVKADAKSDRDNAIGRVKDLKSARDLTTATTPELTAFSNAFATLVPLLANKTFKATDATTTNNPYHFTANDVSANTAGGVVAGSLGGMTYFTDGTTNSFDTEAIATAAGNLRYKITFKYSKAIGTHGNAIATADDANRAYSDMHTNGGTITMTTTFLDELNDPIDSFDSTVTYKVDNSAAAYVHYNDQLNASVNDNADQYGLVNSFANAGGSIIDKKGNDLLQAAVNNGAVTVGKLRASNNNVNETVNGAIDGNFINEGTYYQHIVINLDDLNLQGGALAAYNRGDVTVNGAIPSSTNVDANAYFAKSRGVVDGITYPANSLILKRVVKVGSANVVAKDEKVSGIVTVHTSDITTAPLYDESGKVIVDRSLINNSRWTTDTKRTVLASGKVFYRVSTHEYVSADQVTFEATDPSNSADVVKGDVVVTPLPSIKIIQASYAGSITDLWNKSDDNKSMTRSADRHLAGGTLWRTDQTATVNGVTYYRVSTNEWVPAKYAILQ